VAHLAPLEEIQIEWRDWKNVIGEERGHAKARGFKSGHELWLSRVAIGANVVMGGYGGLGMKISSKGVKWVGLVGFEWVINELGS
jgi:hypothetical protein